MHHEQLGNARSRLVPLAKKRAELDLASYAAGKLDLGTALLSTLALVEAEVDALAREAEVARDAIRINYIYGETRSEERRVGKEGVSQGKTWWPPDHSTKKNDRHKRT